MDILLGLLGIYFAVLQVLLFFKIWRMTDDIREIKQKYLNDSFVIPEDKTIISPEVPKKDSEKKTEPFGSQFKVGDLMIVKANENQFRISSISEENGIKYYFSEKYNKKFPEHEIELFDAYWEKKKNRK